MQTIKTIQAKLQLQHKVLKLYCEEDKEQFYAIFQEVIESGCSFPHQSSSMEDFERCFFAPGSSLYICRLGEEVVGGFYLKSNFPGRAAHIANAAYMVKKSARGKGLGKLLVEASLALAKEMGYKAMQYNLVLSENKAAIALYESLGFTIIATIPEAICKPDGQYQSGYSMYRGL
jgi:ribosomal protein S18 acetylase RimI-like enzyme